MTTDTNLRLSATGLMALVDAYADTAAVNGIRSQWAQMARGNVELALKLRPAPQEHAQPAAVAAPKGLEQIRVGCLTTMNQDDYPGLGGWWVQLRIGSEGDEVLARVYGSSPEQARDRAAALAAVPQAQAEDARDAVKRGEVLVTVSGYTSSGKSAIAGEIEILCRALGLQVQWSDSDSEKNMTHADWTAALEQYKPRVRIVEQNIPFASKKGLSK